MSMKLGYDLTIEQAQKLVMTPELIQAIQILQFNTQELDAYVEEQLLVNPVLETPARIARSHFVMLKTRRNPRQIPVRRISTGRNIFEKDSTMISAIGRVNTLRMRTGTILLNAMFPLM